MGLPNWGLKKKLDDFPFFHKVSYISLEKDYDKL